MLYSSRLFVTCILSSPGWSRFSWSLLTWILPVASFVIVLCSCLFTAIPYSFCITGTKIEASFGFFYIFLVSRNTLPPVFAVLLSKLISVKFFLWVSSLRYDITCKTFCSACVRLNIFYVVLVLRPYHTMSRDGVFRHIYDNDSNLHFIWVSVPLPPTVNLLYKSCIFIMFPLYFTICEMDL